MGDRTVVCQVDEDLFAWLKDVARAQEVGVGEIVRRALTGARDDDLAVMVEATPEEGPVDVAAVVAARLAEAEASGRLSAPGAVSRSADGMVGDTGFFEEPAPQVRPVVRPQRKAVDWARRNR